MLKDAESKVGQVSESGHQKKKKVGQVLQKYLVRSKGVLWVQGDVGDWSYQKVEPLFFWKTK